MKEQKEKEIEIKAKKSKKWNGEKKFYLFTALGCAAALVAIVVVAVAVSGGDKVDNQVNNGTNNEQQQPDDPNDEQVSGLPEGMIVPVQTVNVLNDHAFYHNQTLNCYYEHQGVDFAAEVGTEVMAVEDGIVESIYKNDALVGTEIVIVHEDGLKSVYRFVEEAVGLRVGESVNKGEVIATVAEANGSEYKDGAHLHFEIMKDNESIDPAIYLTLEEK